MKLLPILLLSLLFFISDMRNIPVVVEPVEIVCQSVDKFYQIREFFKQTEYSEVNHVILAVAVLESGWLESKKHVDLNNYFSVKDFQHPICRKNVKSIYCLKQFESLEENLNYMLWYFSSKGYPVDEKGFMLKLEGYAEDDLHTKKVKWIANKFRR